MDLENIKTVPDIIFNGVSVTVLGLVVVFAVLIIIMLFIYAMAFFSQDKKAAEKAAPKTAAEPEPEAAETDEGELIAVITAAVAACMGQSAATVKITSYKRVSNNWQNASKREVLNRY